MGFDLSGIKPKINKEVDTNSIYGMIQSIDDWKERWTMQDKLSKEDKKKYWEQFQEYHDENPGLYFRNNVWWWRPLWEYVCSSCEDILSEEDILAGSYNDGRKISKTKAKKIAERLRLHLDTGIVDKYKSNHDKKLEKLKASEDKDIQFFANYPFDKENVERFALFCEESGGFTIC